MKLRLSHWATIFLVVFCFTGCTKRGFLVHSPNGKLKVQFGVSEKGEISYAVYHSDSIVINSSRLGIIRKDIDFSTNLNLDSVSPIQEVADHYTMLHGKRRECSYHATKQIYYMSVPTGEQMAVIFQVSDDGLAFRYYFPGESDSVLIVKEEKSSFRFNSKTIGFLQPCPDSKTGWESTQPSYEEFYMDSIPVGTPSPYSAGWVMPALFKSGNFWISITEAAVDTNYCASRLSQHSPDGEYFIQFPQKTEGKSGEPVSPESITPWYTPWRIVAISDQLSGLVESTLGTDLAMPAKYDVSDWLKPGKASWSWIMYKDGSINYSIQKEYIDFAAKMNWQYCLIDVNWDRTIGYEKIHELANYAQQKGVKLILWYNSAGDWNTVNFYTPRNKMLLHDSRMEEFRILKEMGIAGVKVDFFGGDGQSMMAYYIGILKDAAECGIAVNFHGSTYPRGWARTYPNLVSMEAIRGEEFITFNQNDADKQPAHCSTIPFTRNLFDPMDFTPVNLSGISGINRKTTDGFEIALSVIFFSGIQHFAESPSGMAGQADFVQQYMKEIPDSWEDVKFIDGYPGKFVVLARKAGTQWYIAGINGENKSREIKLDVGFLADIKQGKLIIDDNNSNELTQKVCDFSSPVTLKMVEYGGFVIVAN